MKILITGAGGFVGKYLIKELQKDSSNDIFGAVFRSTSDIASLLSPDHTIEGDLSDLSFASDLIKRSNPDVIYHLAALSVVGSSVENAVSVMNSNTTISYNLLESVRLYAQKARVIAISSGNVYGAVKEPNVKINESVPLRPLNPYAVSKVSQEMLALMYHLAYGQDIVISRPFNHTGIGQTTEFVIPSLAAKFAKIEKGELSPVIEVGNLDSVRDFTDVRDMVIAYTQAAKSGISGEIYNIGSGLGHTIKEVLDIFQSLSMTKVEIKVSEGLLRTADVPALISDSSKFSALSHWKPKIDLKDTISDILNYYRGI